VVVARWTIWLAELFASLLSHPRSFIAVDRVSHQVAGRLAPRPPSPSGGKPGRRL